MKMYIIAAILLILVIKVDSQCPTTCASIWKSGTWTRCPENAEYRCEDLGCERVKEYCFCYGGYKFDNRRDYKVCVDINECSIDELVGICTGERPAGEGLCGEDHACTLSRINCSTASQPICGNAICTNLQGGYECSCPAPLVLREGMNGLTCNESRCKEEEYLDFDGTCRAICNDTTCECPMEIEMYFEFAVEWSKSVPNQLSQINCRDINTKFTGIATRECGRNSVWGKSDYFQCIREIFIPLQDESRNKNIIALQNNINDVTMEGNKSLLYPGELIIVNTALETLFDKYENIQQETQMYTEEENTATMDTPETAVNTGSYVLSAVNRESWEKVETKTTLAGLVDRFERFSLAINDSNSTISRNNLALAYTRIDTPSSVELSAGVEEGNETKMNVKISEEFIRLVRESCNETFFSSIVFRTIKELTPKVNIPGSDTQSNDTQMEKAILLSDVISLNTKQCSITTNIPKEAVKIEFMLKTNPKVNYTDTEFRCAFWNLTTNTWSTKGVDTKIEQQINGTVKITCTPTHLTSFAILLSSYTPTDIDNTIQTALSAVTCILSVVCLIATLVCFLILYIRTRKSSKNPFKQDSIFILHINFCVAMLLAIITFLTSALAVGHVVPCTVLAAIQHYLWLSVFCWYLCEGIAIAWKIRFWDKSQILWPVLLPLGWGLPIPIVLITIPIAYRYYVDPEISCWINNNNNLKLYSFILPILLIISVNVLIYIYTLVTMYRIQKKKEDTNKRAVSLIIGSLVLLPLLGIPWIIGVFYVSQETTVFAYIFIILIGLQGVFFFIAHVVRNTMIQDYVFKWRSPYNEHAKFKPLHSVSFNTDKSSVQTRSVDEYDKDS